MLLRNGKNRGETINDDLISARQKYLDLLESARVAEDEFLCLDRKKDRAFNEFTSCLKVFDDYYGGGRK